MNSSPNAPSNATQSPDRDRKPAERQSAGAVEAKLKEAQANLMDAEGKLMASSVAAPPANAPPPSNEPPKSSAIATTEAPMTAATQPAVPKPAQEKQTQAPAVPLTERVPENVAGMLCYLFGWVSGLVFLLFDRRPFVRFHAAQSVAIFATLSILLLALSGSFLGAIPRLAVPLEVVSHVLELVWLVAAVVLMLKAAAGERYPVKIASQYAERASHGAKP